MPNQNNNDNWKEEFKKIYFSKNDTQPNTRFNQLYNFIDSIISQVKKEYNDICPKCRGKGYSTEFRGYTISPDFIGDVRYNSPIKIEINYCDCQRGKQIKELIDNVKQQSEKNHIMEIDKKISKEFWDNSKYGKIILDQSYNQGKMDGMEESIKIIDERIESMEKYCKKIGHHPYGACEHIYSIEELEELNAEIRERIKLITK